ncbi:AMP-binding protein [Kitasatospora sp. NPDC006697]|uniref:AMP-binding protein n=1 Tax=Kitasatospora sp. NPDC006697 TaxID=3364020 RepID=UPI00369A5F6F
MFRSEFPDIPIVELPLHETVLGNAAEYGELPALIDGLTGETLTHAGLAELVRQVAAGLAEAGVAQGDVVALHSPNSIAYPVAVYAISQAGAILTTVSSLATPEELAGQLRDSGARWLISAPVLLPVAFAATAAPGGPELAGIFRTELTPRTDIEGHRTLGDLAASTAPVPAPVIDPATDVAALPYSSGTTGLPKGVMLTHQSIGTNLNQVDVVRPPYVGERMLAVLPFFHIYALTMLMHRPLRAGGVVVVLPRFDLEQFLTAIQKHRIEGLLVAPPIVLALAKHPVVDRFDLSSLRYVLSAAAPLDADLAAACAARLGQPHIQQGYGLTELSPACAVDLLTDPQPSAGSVGVLIASTELRVITTDGSAAELGTGETGEILIRGPQVMKGYLGRPSDTDAMVDAEGWLHTGDIGFLDDRGYLHIVDRVKELIKYKGYQVAPAELEALLLGHPGIADAAVIGATDAEGTERPKAFVVRAPGAGLDAEAVMAYVAERVAPYKKVREVVFLDAVPKSAAGKILRRELRGK